MKTHLSVILFAAVLITAGCKKKEDPAPTPDTSPPVISLKGSTNDTISLNSTYTDPGAKATDNVDGDLSASVIATGNVNTNQVGEYRRYYNVKDAAGNAAAQMTRYVYVRNDADFLVGMYNASANCGATQTSAFVTTVTVSGTVNNGIMVGSLGNLVQGLSPEITINGSVMSILSANVGSQSYSGNGSIGFNKKEFTLNYSISNQSGTWNCSTTYKKQ
jgi:hypothetical protein